MTFSEEDLPRDDCEYILGYYSNNMNSIVGLSTPLQVRDCDIWLCKLSTEVLRLASCESVPEERVL